MIFFSCRPHITGRRCDQPEEEYFIGSLDHLTYEAELAKGSEVIIYSNYFLTLYCLIKSVPS